MLTDPWWYTHAKATGHTTIRSLTEEKCLNCEEVAPWMLMEKPNPVH